MILLLEYIIVFFVSFLMAIWHKHLIVDKKINIKHGLWAAIFCSLIIAIMLWRHSFFLPFKLLTIIFPIACLIGHRLVFDISLNKLRKLPWDYLNPDGKSIIDKLEYGFFGKKIWISKLILCIIFIILQFFIHV